MGKAVVLLFLLDTLPDFNKVINKRLHVLPDKNTISCSRTFNEAIFEVINQQVEFNMAPTERKELPSENHQASDSFEDLSSDTLYNTIYDNSIQDSVVDFLDKSISINQEGISVVTESNEDVSECEKPSIELNLNSKQNSKESYPESAPFLAAIFETVSNVTAQTCGGVLMATRWVLTAASCVNVLAHFYSNTSHQTNSSYTIVIGATNPLKDGTVHNVSEIILHPNISSFLHHSDSSLHLKKLKSTLALMRIEPGLKEGMLQMAGVKMDSDVTTEMYGWALVQNETGPSTMMATSIPVEALSPAKCEIVYGALEIGTLCLSINDASPNITRMTSGGPVVVSRGRQRRLLAVGLGDGAPLLASAVPAHRQWLQRVTGAD